jgi:hypothetical protein
MAKPKRGPVGGTFFKLRDAEQAAKVLREKKVAVEIVEVSLLICRPETAQIHGWALFVSRDNVRKASRLLDQAGSGKVRLP